MEGLLSTGPTPSSFLYYQVDKTSYGSWCLTVILKIRTRNELRDSKVVYMGVIFIPFQLHSLKMQVSKNVLLLRQKIHIDILVVLEAP